MEGDPLYFHDAQVRWFRYHDKFYKWKTGTGWHSDFTDQVPDITLFHVPHPNGLEAILKGLREQKLID
ncbi:hypothetical protein GCM10028805_16230 [Spirosoma harenae]